MSDIDYVQLAARMFVYKWIAGWIIGLIALVIWIGCIVFESLKTWLYGRESSQEKTHP